MSDTPPFKEDFFERVVDVKWESEPEVHWMIGSGAALIVNAMPYGDTMAWMWTSDNGKKWKGQNLGIRPVQKGFGVLYCGCWMRDGLREGAPPVWVMGGGTSRLQATSAMGSSTDAKTFGNMVSMDERHVCEQIGPSNGGIYMYGFATMAWHYDYFSSSDGITWSPDNYHGGDTSGSGRSAETVSIEEAEDIALGYARATNLNELTPVVPRSSLVKILTSGPVQKLEVPPTRRLLMPREAVTPMNSPGLFATGAESKGDKMVFNECGVFASGKVRTGPFKGKRIGVAITPYHYYPGGGDHGDSTVAVYDMKSGQQQRSNSEDGLYDTGIKRSIAVGYGHYTFVVTGSSGGAGRQNTLANTKSTIAWSTTGVTWKKVELGIHDQINVIAVGPRPKHHNPTDNPIEEPPPPVKPPSGPGEQPPNPVDPGTGEDGGGAAAP